jgi:hypothetical protein
MRVNLIYDPTKSTLKRELAMSGVTQELLSQVSENSMMLKSPNLIQKSGSHHPAFMHLADVSS